MGRQHTNRIHQDQVGPSWDTVQTLARELCVCERTIRRQIQRGAIRAHYIGRDVRISPAAKQEFLDSIVVDPATFRG